MTLELPLRVLLPRKKKEGRMFSLNLNVYRNAHHQVLNEAKKAYVQAVLEAVADRELSVDAPFVFEYVVYPPTRRRMDLGNVLPVVQKFTEDALVELSLLPDDSYEFIRAVRYGVGEVDKVNPRVELRIYGYEEEGSCPAA